MVINLFSFKDYFEVLIFKVMRTLIIFREKHNEFSIMVSTAKRSIIICMVEIDY